MGAAQPLTRQQKERKLILLREKAERRKERKAFLQWETFYDWQKEFCNSTSTYYESCLCAGNQIGKCNSFNTLIETEYGAMKIGDIFGKKIRVKTFPNNELKNVAGWVVKDPEECFRITLRDGSWVECPLGHKILVGDKFLSAEEIFQSLPESVFSRPRSTSAFGQLARISGVQRLTQKAQDFLGRCLVGFRLYDEQPRHVLDNGLVYSPLQGGAQPRSARLLRLGGLVCKGIYSLFGKLFRLSSQDVDCRFSAPFFSRLYPSSSCAYQSSMDGSQAFLQSRESEYLVQSKALFDRYQSSFQVSLPSDDPIAFAVNEIVSVYSVGRKWLYDMEVEDRHNYIAGGMVHHNTYTGTTLDAFHLMGKYPEDFEGHRFEHAPLCWGLGYSMEKTRDLLQTALFGKYIEGSFQGGLVPKSKIVRWESAMGTPNAMRAVYVEHSSGKQSCIQFWSYAQGQSALMGDVVDWFHIDEEPKDHTIRPQVLTRTINGDKGMGGRGIYTFTPENGRTELVIMFMDNPSKDQKFMRKGWDDAPHITPEKKERMLAQYPSYQRDMRTKGIPMLGHGRIYEFSREELMVTPFEIPDHWYVGCGLDFGWDHPQALVKIAWDMENNVFYLTNCWKASKKDADQAWGATKDWSANVPVAWPLDGLQNEKGRSDATQQKEHYTKAGFKLMAEYATHPPIIDEKGEQKTGGNSVEQGIVEIRNLKSRGQFKIFSSCVEYFDEMEQYHRKEPNSDGVSKIAKILDDLLDSVRYAYMMRRFFIPKSDIIGNNRKQVYIPQPLRPRR